MIGVRLFYTFIWGSLGLCLSASAVHTTASPDGSPPDNCFLEIQRALMPRTSRFGVQAGARRQLLIVDNGATAKRQWNLVLEEHFNVVFASSEEEAIRVLQKERIDLIVVRQTLEAQNGGILFCGKLREEHFEGRPIVVVGDLGVGSRQEATDLQLAFELGHADEFVGGSAHPHELVARITHLLSRHERLTHFIKLSQRDGLTGAYNRRYLDAYLSYLFGAAKKHGTELSVLMVDIDHFKKFNDTHGHEGGDDVLRGIAAVVGSVLRGGDLLVRYGGEEFTIVIRGGLKEATEVGERVRAAVEAHIFELSNHTRAKVTVSIGAASLAQAAFKVADDLRVAADLALYSAKHPDPQGTHPGRNRVMAWGPRN